MDAAVDAGTQDRAAEATAADSATMSGPPRRIAVSQSLPGATQCRSGLAYLYLNSLGMLVRFFAQPSFPIHSVRLKRTVAGTVVDRTVFCQMRGAYLQVYDHTHQVEDEIASHAVATEFDAPNTSGSDVVEPQPEHNSASTQAQEMGPEAPGALNPLRTASGFVTPISLILPNHRWEWEWQQYLLAEAQRVMLRSTKQSLPSTLPEDAIPLTEHLELEEQGLSKATNLPTMLIDPNLSSIAGFQTLVRSISLVEEYTRAPDLDLQIEQILDDDTPTPDPDAETSFRIVRPEKGRAPKVFVLQTAGLMRARKLIQGIRRQSREFRLVRCGHRSPDTEQLTTPMYVD